MSKKYIVLLLSIFLSSYVSASSLDECLRQATQYEKEAEKRMDAEPNNPVWFVHWLHAGIYTNNFQPNRGGQICNNGQCIYYKQYSSSCYILRDTHGNPALFNKPIDGSNSIAVNLRTAINQFNSRQALNVTDIKQLFCWAEPGAFERKEYHHFTCGQSLP